MGDTLRDTHGRDPHAAAFGLVEDVKQIAGVGGGSFRSSIVLEVAVDAVEPESGSFQPVAKRLAIKGIDRDRSVVGKG